MFAILAGSEFGTLCQLRDSISVNQASTYSALFLDAAADSSAAESAPPSDGLPALRTNDGSSRSNSGSTRSFMSFRDGFIETRMVRAFNVSDVEGAPLDPRPLLPLVLDGSAGVAGIVPTRMLLLAPIWASFHDPFYTRVVPAWACASFSWGRKETRAALVAAWSNPWRFGITLHDLDPDYRVYQGGADGPGGRTGACEGRHQLGVTQEESPTTHARILLLAQVLNKRMCLCVCFSVPLLRAPVVLLGC